PTPTGNPTPLPTYPFQHQTYWLDAPTPTPTDFTPTGHPLLDATVELAGSESLLHTGRLSLATHPWLADHSVLGTVVVPGSALVDLALFAGGRLDELVLENPLVLPREGAVQLQVAVGADDESGRRTVTVHSRPAGSGDRTWSCHASGFLTPDDLPYDDPAVDPALLVTGSWVPGDAVAMDLSGLYDRLADRGYDYGPAFQGLRAAWQHGTEVYAEVALPEGTDGSGFGLHPTLLDSALHPLILLGGGDEVRLPFSWHGVSLRATGATSLRVRLTPGESGTIAIALSDDTGLPIASVAALASRAVAPERLAAAGQVPGDGLYALDWVPAAGSAGALPGPWHVLDDELGLAEELRASGLTVADGTPGPGPDGMVLVPIATADVHELTHRVLALVQRWVRSEGPRLVLVTRGAVGAAPDPALAAIWGLARSAQAEHPDRIVLLDLDGSDGSPAALPAALATGEPQLAIRAGEVLVPRLAALPAAGGEPLPTPWDPDATVLITGATGSLGALLARHLVTRHGVRHLLLTGRRETDPALVTELTGLGAEVTTAVCDIADRAAVTALLESVPAAHPLRAVLHSAGVLDDGVLDSLTPERLDTVLRPKADAAGILDELTRGLDLTAFVLFSSVAGTFGTPGQANYAAANAFLDALAARRRAAGPAALSLAWGPWEQTGMAGALADADRARIARTGVVPLTVEDGLALFDRALGLDRPAALPVRLDLPTLRAAAGPLPPVLRGLVRPAARRSAARAVAGGAEQLRRRLADGTDEQRYALLLDLVSAQTAAVLGHDGAAAVSPGRGFLDLGVDSLTAVELRNRLNDATGLQLPSTVIFDHPTAAALATELQGLLAVGPARGDDLLLAELDRLAHAFGTVSDDGRAAVSARLQKLLSLVGHDPHAAAEVAGQIGSATDDEVFAFIDNELGI
ncbi:type I polyketide synthase, partial [Kitasatospora sp. NPDC059408]|uniref:type I polyketide synthase n=1 Tax=Kitasatospora sp. NPDC059408 TaxID=3346823 RepID=UPI00369B4809